MENKLVMTIPLAPVTKKNSGRIVHGRGGHRLLPSKAFTDYQAAAWPYLKGRNEKIDRPCQVTVLFYMKTRRIVDLTNLLEAIDDVLVQYGVLSDDNSRIIVSHDGSRVLYDKENPRTEITITFLEDEKC